MKSRLTITVAASVLAIIAPLTALATQATAQAAPASACGRRRRRPRRRRATPVPTTPVPPTPVPTPTPRAHHAGADADRGPDPGRQQWRRSGVRFNEPRDPKKSHAINRYIRIAIANTPKGSQIRLVTRNYSNALYVNDIIAAHKRGVSVQIIMANGLAQSQGAGSSTRARGTRWRRGTRSAPAWRAGSAPA